MNVGIAPTLRYVIAFAAICGAFYSVLLARTEFLLHQDTEDSITKAARSLPTNPVYVARLAAWQPDQKVALLKKAVALNPFDAESWIQLGLTAEMEGRNVSLAEHYYLQSASVDKMFLPKWTLANFYFRHRREEDFFRWATATLDITPYPAEPVFSQMWLMTSDSERIGRAIPNRPGTLVAYLRFLTKEKHFSAIPPVVQRFVHALAQAHGTADAAVIDLLGSIEDRLLEAGQVEPALQIWSALTEAGWFRSGLPTLAEPLTNGAFHHPFLRHGFDWTPISAAGISVAQHADTGSVQIELTGAEEEHAVILRQYVPLISGHSYRLTWKATSERFHDTSGLTWHLYPLGKQQSKSLTSPDLFSSQSPGWDFRWTEGTPGSVLVLEYNRPLGAVRANGNLKLNALALRER